MNGYVCGRGVILAPSPVRDALHVKTQEGVRPSFRWAARSTCPCAQAIDPGHVDWNEWSFDYEFTNRSGLVLRDVRYKNFYFIHKVSLPVTRVQYDGDAAGPYQDRDNCSNDLHYGCLMKINNCDNK